MARYHPNPPNGAIYDQDDLDRLRAHAVASERERCAKLVEALGKVSSNDTIWQAAQTMAAEIRKQ